MLKFINDDNIHNKTAIQYKEQKYVLYDVNIVGNKIKYLKYLIIIDS